MTVHSWQKVWREGFAPQISDAGLEALKEALITDDPRLIQGATCSPPPLPCVADWPVEGGCAITYCGWQGDHLPTVEKVEDYFAQRCLEANQLLGEPAACLWFLNWFDDTPRGQMRTELLAEVRRSLRERESHGQETQAEDAPGGVGAALDTRD